MRKRPRFVPSALKLRNLVLDIDGIDLIGSHTDLGSAELI